MNKHSAADLKATKIRGGVATDQRHDSAHKHVAGEAIYIDDMPEPAGTLHGCLGLSTVAHGTILGMDLSGVRAAPGVVDVLTGADVPGENDISPTGRHDEPVLAERVVEFFGQPIFAVIARDAGRGPSGLPARQGGVRAPAGGDRHRRARPRRGQDGHAAADAEARRRPCGDRRGAAPAHRPDAGGRPGPLLPGRPYRHGGAGRGPGRHRLFLDPASERGAAYGGACAGRALARGDGRDPSHGRRLWRQGDPVEPVRGHRGDRRQAARPGREDPAGPRRRHDRHRQASRFPDRL